MCENSKKKNFLGGGGQGGCEWRSEAFVKIQKKKKFFLGGGGWVGGGGGGVRVDGNGEVIPVFPFKMSKSSIYQTPSMTRDLHHICDFPVQSSLHKPR